MNILEFPEIRCRVAPISVKEYHRLGKHNAKGRRTELIRGIILEILDRSPRHRLSASGFARIPERPIPEGLTARVNAPLTFQDSEPEPDFAIVKGSEKDYREAHPTTAVLVIEVTDGDGELERAMASIYAEAGVEEYWINLVEKNEIEVYRRPVDGEYQERTTIGHGAVTCERIPAISVTLGCWSD